MRVRTKYVGVLLLVGVLIGSALWTYRRDLWVDRANFVVEERRGFGPVVVHVDRTELHAGAYVEQAAPQWERAHSYRLGMRRPWLKSRTALGNIRGLEGLVQVIPPDDRHAAVERFRNIVTDYDPNVSSGRSDADLRARRYLNDLSDKYLLKTSEETSGPES